MKLPVSRGSITHARVVPVFSCERVRDLEGSRNCLIPSQRVASCPSDRELLSTKRQSGRGRTRLHYRGHIPKDRLTNRLAQALRRAKKVSGHREATGTARDIREEDQILHDDPVKA